VRDHAVVGEADWGSVEGQVAGVDRESGASPVGGDSDSWRSQYRPVHRLATSR
jgi:hypothetical protein